MPPTLQSQSWLPWSHGNAFTNTAGFESALEEAGEKKEQRFLLMISKGHVGQGQDSSISAWGNLCHVYLDRKTSVEKLGTVTLKIHHELTPLSQLQPRKQLPHGWVAPCRSPTLPGIRMPYECRGPMLFLMRSIKGFFKIYYSILFF